jgi:hypothetical protein
MFAPVKQAKNSKQMKNRIFTNIALVFLGWAIIGSLAFLATL